MSGIALNEDWAQYFIFRDETQMNEEALRKWVRQYADTQLKELFLNPNGMRVSYPSKARDYIAQGYDPDTADQNGFYTALPQTVWETIGHFEWPRHLWLLQQQGINPYLVWIDECRKQKISPWISFRMNDMHGVMDESYYMHSTFWREHPEYRVAEDRFGETGNLYDRVLDYAHPAVRNHAMALITEYLEWFDMDGLELDFVRNDVCFRPGFEEQGREIMLSFVKDVRRQIDRAQVRHGHEIHLGVRVPMHPETALSWGIDVHAFVQEGGVDTVIPCNHYDSPANDAPIALWRQLVGESVTLMGGLDIGMRAYPGGPFHKNSIETVRGMASTILQKGADRVYLFNYMPLYSEIERTPEMLREVGSPQTLMGKSRRYVVTYDDGHAAGTRLASLLPLKMNPGQMTDVRIHLGEVGTDKATVRIGLTDNADHAPKLRVRLNGMSCVYSGTMLEPVPGPRHMVFRYVPLNGAAHDGGNMLELYAKEKLEIDWLEIELNH